MTCASFPSQTLSPTPRSKSLPQPSSAACVCLHFIETNQKRGRYLRGKTAISRSSTRLLPWVPLCARKPPPRGESQKQEQMAPSSPLSDLIHGFYSSVNEKELSRLEKLLSKDCIFEASAYSKPLQGKVIKQVQLRHRTNKVLHNHYVFPSVNAEDQPVLQGTHGSHGNSCKICHRRGVRGEGTNDCSNMASW